jgi:uncharacterized coiled-coil protein SlyX
MRNAVVFILVVVILTLIGTSAVLYQSNRTASAQVAEMQTASVEADARYGRVFDAIAEIQDSLEVIAKADAEVQLLSEQLETEQGMNAPTEREALERIESIKAGIGRTKDRIGDLEADLKKSGIKVASLNKMINGLKGTVSEQEASIANLNTEVSTLQTKVTDLETTVQTSQDELRATNEVLDEKNRESRTIYYLVGNKKELEEAGAIEAKGGFIGIGKTVKPTGAFPTGKFTSLDTDNERVVTTRAEKAQVLTSQTASSYELREVDGQMQLHIIDPVEFSKVKYLLIMTS